MKLSNAKEIASALNLSVSTVYRVLNNTGRISEKTRKQVLEYASAVGYQPNLIAQGLAKRKKYHIAHVIYSSPSNWWKQIKVGAEKAAQELSEFGVKVSFVEYSPVPPYEESINLLDMIEKEELDGIILVPSSHPEIIKAIEAAQERKIPIVCINVDAPLTSQRLFHYGPNEETVGLLAGELVGKMINGKGNISIVGSESADFRFALRERGFFQQIYKYFPNISILHQNAFPPDNFKKYLCDLLHASGNDISAIYVEDSMLLSETASILKSLDLSDIVVIGHECLGNCREFLEEGWISATICQETFSQGYYPLKLLYHHLLTGAPVKPNYYSNVNVVCRSSLGFLQQNEDGCGFQ